MSDGLLPDWEWLVAKDGQPISPKFETWREAAIWADQHKHGSFDKIAKVPSLRCEPEVETWDHQQIAEYAELQSIL